MPITMTGMATPIPILAPVLRPEDGGVGLVVGDAEGVGVWLVASAAVDRELDEEVLEEVVVELLEVLELELDIWRVALCAEESKVLVGTPASDSLNLPTPVSQQSFVWSQQ